MLKIEQPCNLAGFVAFQYLRFFLLSFSHIQLFQLTLSDQNKAKRQDRNVLWDYFL